jgi:hypothetical protein
VNPWDELRRTFVHAEYVATILCGQAFLEYLLAGILEWHEEGSAGRSGLADMMQRAQSLGWITPDEYDLLDRLRRIRNPYAHYRDAAHPESLIRRAMATDEPPDVVAERDARAVVEALLHLVNRPPFALGPIVYPKEEGPFLHPNQTQMGI